MADIRFSPALDDCNRANESPLSHGGRWAPATGGPSNWNNYYPGLMLNANHITHYDPASSPSATSVSYWKETIFYNPVEVWAKSGAGFDLSEAWRMFLNLQSPDLGVSGYELQINNAVGTNNWRISRWDGGGKSTVVQFNAGTYDAAPLGTDEHALFRYVDGVLSCWRDHVTGGVTWTQVGVNASDGAYDHGYLGLGIDQDDNNPGWRGFGGGERKHTQIYRYVYGAVDVTPTP